MKFKVLLTLYTLIFASALTGCFYSEPDPGIAYVVVLDENDFRVPGATVILHQEGQQGDGTVYDEGFSDLDGVYKYTHEPALEIIAFVDVAKDTCTGKGTVRIIPNEVVYDTIKIFC